MAHNSGERGRPRALAIFTASASSLMLVYAAVAAFGGYRVYRLGADARAYASTPGYADPNNALAGIEQPIVGLAHATLVLALEACVFLSAAVWTGAWFCAPPGRVRIAIGAWLTVFAVGRAVPFVIGAASTTIRAISGGDTPGAMVHAGQGIADACWYGSHVGALVAAAVLPALVVAECRRYSTGTGPRK